MRQIEFLSFALAVLERLSIPYAVVGSYASTAWGEPRMTRDIDIVIQLSANQVEPLCAAFPASDFYVSDFAAKEAVDLRRQFNVLHPASGNKIDFMVIGTGDWPESQLARRRRVSFGPSVFGFVAAPEDVILGKLIYYQDGHSEKHVRDIRGIIKVSGSDLDLAYLDRCAVQLGVSEIWASIASGADDQ